MNTKRLTLTLSLAMLGAATLHAPADAQAAPVDAGVAPPTAPRDADAGDAATAPPAEAPQEAERDSGSASTADGGADGAPAPAQPTAAEPSPAPTAPAQGVPKPPPVPAAPPAVPPPEAAAEAALEGATETSSVMGKPVTLEEAIAMALKQHPRVTSARHTTVAAEARVNVAKSGYYPRIDAWLQAIRGTANGSLALYHSPPGTTRIGGRRPDGLGAADSLNNFLAAATVQQLIYDFGRTQGEVAARKALVDGAKLNEKLVEQSVVFDVTRAYYQVLANKEGVRVAEDGVQLTQRVFDLAKTAQRAGLRPPSDSARAEADVAAAELLLIQARGELDMALAQIIHAVGGAEEALDPVSEVPEQRVPTDTNEALTIALRERYEPRALDFQEQALQQRLRSTRADHYPRIDALASINTRGQFLNPNYDDFAVNNWNVGVRMQVPIFEGMRVSEQMNAIQAELNALHHSREAVRQTIELEVRQALAQLRSAEEAVRAASKGAEAALVALDTTVGRYESGLANIVEITDAQTAYMSASSAAQRANYDLRLARARLRLAMGTLNAE